MLIGTFTITTNPQHVYWGVKVGAPFAVPDLYAVTTAVPTACYISNRKFACKISPRNISKLKTEISQIKHDCGKAVIIN